MNQKCVPQGRREKEKTIKNRRDLEKHVIICSIPNGWKTKHSKAHNGPQEKKTKGTNNDDGQIEGFENKKRKTRMGKSE